MWFSTTMSLKSYIAEWGLLSADQWSLPNSTWRTTSLTPSPVLSWGTLKLHEITFNLAFVQICLFGLLTTAPRSDKGEAEARGVAVASMRSVSGERSDSSEPLEETSEYHPVNPYANSKVATEVIARYFAQLELPLEDNDRCHSSKARVWHGCLDRKSGKWVPAAKKHR